jgi:hypothetical protein
VAEFHACHLAEATRKPKGGRRAALAPPGVALGVSGLALFRLLPRLRFLIPAAGSSPYVVPRSSSPRPNPRASFLRTRFVQLGDRAGERAPLALLPPKRLGRRRRAREQFLSASASIVFSDIHLCSLKSQTSGPLVFSLFACRSHS